MTLFSGYLDSLEFNLNSQQSDISKMVLDCLNLLQRKSFSDQIWTVDGTICALRKCINLFLKTNEMKFPQDVQLDLLKFIDSFSHVITGKILPQNNPRKVGVKKKF